MVVEHVEADLGHLVVGVVAVAALELLQGRVPPDVIGQVRQATRHYLQSSFRCAWKEERVPNVKVSREEGVAKFAVLVEILRQVRI